MKLTRSDSSLKDIENCLFWSIQKFGEKAAIRYKHLVEVAISEICNDSELLGSSPIPEFGEDIRIYHLRHSRKRAEIGGKVVKNARHFVVYQKSNDEIIQIIRVLYDGMDIEQEMREEFSK